MGFLLNFFFSCIALNFLNGVLEQKFIKISLNGEIFTLEIADTPAKQQQGLMYRKKLHKNYGMLFIFNGTDYCSFWMQNTYIPLSIAYVSIDGVINEIYTMEPLSLAIIRSKKPCKYAIEVRQGTYARLGIKVGDKVKFLEKI